MVVTDHHIIDVAAELIVLGLEVKNLAFELISAFISRLSLVSASAIALER